MGGSSQVTGQRYYIGFQCGICIAPVDAVTALDYGQRIAWTGEQTTSGIVDIDKPNLFGGDEQQGGISGVMEVCMGEKTQAPNAYVQRKAKHRIPAYRGFLSLVFRGRTATEIDIAGLNFLPYSSPESPGQYRAPYVGKSGIYFASMNPYIKDVAVTVRRILAGWTTPVWYPEAARIGDDMNFAHICYQALTDRIQGLKKTTGKIDDASFRAAALTLFNEGFGLSCAWSQTGSLWDFLGDLGKHVDCVLDTDLQTGLYTLKLIRNDYDPDTLPLFDTSNILEMNNFVRPGWGETINELTIQYTNPADNSLVPITVHNLANIKIQNGETVSDTHTYVALTNKDLAARVALRDLRVVSTPLAHFSIKTNRDGATLKKGYPLRVTWPDNELVEVVCRVLDADYGTLDDGTCSFEIIEDVFALPDSGQSYVVQPDSGWVNPSAAPAPVATVFVNEIPYYILQQLLSANTIADLNPNASFPLLIAEKPGDQNSRFTGYSSPASDFSGATKWNSGDYTPTCLLNGGITWNQTVLHYDTVGDEDPTHFVNGFAFIDDEVVFISSVDAGAGTITVKRGCLYSIPVLHADNATVWLYNDGTFSSGIAIANADSVKDELVYYRETGRSMSGETDLATAPQQAHTHQASWNAPYPPANVKLDGAYFPTSVGGSFTITWAGRNRLQQTTSALIGWTEASIAAETGVTYTLEVYDSDTDTLISTTPGMTLPRTGEGSFVYPGGGSATHYRIEFYAVRGTVRSTQSFDHTCAAVGNTGSPPPATLPTPGLTRVPTPFWINGAWRDFELPYAPSSTDGSTWTNEAPMTAVDAGLPDVVPGWNVSFGNSLYVVTNNTSWYWWRTTTSAWTAVDTSAWSTGIISGGLCHNITFDGSQFVMVRNDAKDIFTSPDLVTWTRQGTGGVANALGAGMATRKVDFVGGVYVASGSQVAGLWPSQTTTSYIATSTDLAAWYFTAVPDKFSDSSYAVYWAGRYNFITLQGNRPTAYYSTDLQNWTAQDLGVSFPDGDYSEQEIFLNGQLYVYYPRAGVVLLNPAVGSASIVKPNFRVPVLGGKLNLITTEDPPGHGFVRVGSPVEYGGKLLYSGGYNDTGFSATYPIGAPLGGHFGTADEAYEGDIYHPAYDDSGLTNTYPGYPIALPMLHRLTGKYYCEFTVLGFAPGFPQARQNTFAVQLAPYPPQGPLSMLQFVGNSNLDFSPQVGDVMGLLLDLDNGTLELKLNNVSKLTKTGIDRTTAWVAQALTDEVLLHANVGEEGFHFNQSGFSAWGP